MLKLILSKITIYFLFLKFIKRFIPDISELVKNPNNFNNITNIKSAAVFKTKDNQSSNPCVIKVKE